MSEDQLREQVTTLVELCVNRGIDLPLGEYGLTRPLIVEKFDYDVALRNDRSGVLYDVVVNCKMVRIKRLNDDWWIACYLPTRSDPDDRITFNIGDQGLSVGERPEGRVTYEAEA